ncbi:hypothetical protein SLEP1_g24513 [Rubroshorea leprosula]|uniref:Uncharacterized protein n=1 Tax=Rubroshorea leprosula TaxID=152421 RepID=A0AAV5JM28_9ROSI|nr:hypothetical protein SLEP1_g24513 [Rubroshorea leprosula]
MLDEEGEELIDEDEDEELINEDGKERNRKHTYLKFN